MHSQLRSARRVGIEVDAAATRWLARVICLLLVAGVLAWAVREDAHRYPPARVIGAPAPSELAQAGDAAHRAGTSGSSLGPSATAGGPDSGGRDSTPSTTGSSRDTQPDWEEEFLAAREPGAIEVARGLLPDGRSKWRLYVYPHKASYCLSLSSLVYEPAPGVPFKSSSSAGCDYPDPMAVTGNTVAQHGILWFGAVNPAAARVVARVSGGSEVEATMSGLDQFRRRAFVVLLPDETGLHEFVAVDGDGREVGRTTYANTGTR